MTDTTRPHPRVQKYEPRGRRVTLETGTLFIPQKTRSVKRLVVHFHGAGWLIEHHTSRLRDTAVVWVQLGAGSGIYSRTFSDASRFPKMLEQAGIRQARLTVSSFSAGYGAVREILRQGHRFDALILADSLHTGYTTGNMPGPLESEPLASFLAYAREAVAGRTRMLLTHSEVFPGTFASTTETADYLLRELGVHRRPVLKKGPAGMQQLSECRSGRFELRGFAGNTAPDHMDHLYALGDWLRNFG